jgi:hypothetical protein
MGNQPSSASDRGDEATLGDDSGGSGRRSYLRFGAMIATSTAVMFCLAHTNTYARQELL